MNDVDRNVTDTATTARRIARHSPAEAGIQLFLLTSFPRKRGPQQRSWSSIFLFVLSFNKGEELDCGLTSSAVESRRNDEQERARWIPACAE
jgi:hypothetical protein